MTTTTTSKNQAGTPRRAPQNKEIRSRQLAEYDDALAVLGRIESEAGSTLQGELARSKRVQGAYQVNEDRERFRRRRLGQRSGLLRLMTDELGTDPAFTERSRLYVRHMLIISANVAAVTGSGWKSTLSWFHSHLPAITDEKVVGMEGDFDWYVAKALIELGERSVSGDPALLTGPTPAEIAEALGTTTVQLRQARANTCGLTSIDPQDRKASDRERKTEARRKAGVKPQAERTSKVEMKALAGRIGCNVATLYRKRLNGTLGAFLEANGHAATDVSAVVKEFDDGHFGRTPANDDDKVPKSA